MKRVLVTQEIGVTVDRSKFTEEFMAEFRKSFFPFFTVDDHLEHLGQLYARGVVDNGEFIEGYGPAKDMGISFMPIDSESEVLI